MDSHRLKTVYYINKLDLKEIKPFSDGAVKVAVCCLQIKSPKS